MKKILAFVLAMLFGVSVASAISSQQPADENGTAVEKEQIKHTTLDTKTQAPKK